MVGPGQAQGEEGLGIAEGQHPPPPPLPLQGYPGLHPEAELESALGHMNHILHPHCCYSGGFSTQLQDPSL